MVLTPRGAVSQMDTEPEPEPPADAAAVNCLPVGAGSGAEKQPGGSVEKKKKKNRCGACRKKVGLTGFECRCGGLFCGMHRMADGHSCTFDFKAAGKELLEQRFEEGSVTAAKFEKVRRSSPCPPCALRITRNSCLTGRCVCSRRSERPDRVSAHGSLLRRGQRAVDIDRFCAPTAHEMMGVRASAGPVAPVLLCRHVPVMRRGVRVARWAGQILPAWRALAIG